MSPLDNFNFSINSNKEKLELGEDQVNALQKLEEFVSSMEDCITLSGFAGTGNKYLEYCRLYEESYRELQTNIGEDCDVNAEISTETKESVPS